MNENEVHYNPSSPVPPTPVETRLVAKYYVESEGNTITLFYSQGGSGSGSGSGGEVPFSAMEIDGVELSEVVNEYTFDTVGEHIVKYTLTDPTSIGNQAFYQCTGLTSIDIPDSVTSIYNDAFAQCTGLTSCTIGSGVTSIGGNAFYQCTSLTSIDIPDSVTTIGGNAFYQCTSLTSIVSNAVTAPTIDSTTFFFAKTSGTLYVPQGSSGYDVWMQNVSYYLGLYGWTKVEQ